MEFKVSGIDSNDNKVSVIVKAPYGHKAIQYAEMFLNTKFKSAMAMKVIHYKN
jgi:hypothetical protein